MRGKPAPMLVKIPLYWLAKCAWCHSEYIPRKARTLCCSIDCRSKYRAAISTPPGTVTCRRCDSLIIGKQSHVVGRDHCGRTCSNRSRNTAGNCARCGRRVAKKKNRFCSRECISSTLDIFGVHLSTRDVASILNVSTVTVINRHRRGSLLRLT
jgi:hypothetical protein